jgi:hypothetical protein
MTAEIVIMNKEAMALAADSAVSLTINPFFEDTKPKIFTSANKIFTLSKTQPVAIMIYGNSALIGVPWEIIIKEFRKKIKRQSFPHLLDYASEFIQFLDSSNPILPDNFQREYVETHILHYFSYLKECFLEKVEEMIDENEFCTGEEIRKTISEMIKNEFEMWRDGDNIPSLPDSFHTQVERKYSEVITRELKQIFEELPLSKTDMNRIRKIIGHLFSKYPKGADDSGRAGIIIAGFGTDDIFPVLKSYSVSGVVENRLKYLERETHEITVDMDAGLFAFAQREMVARFMKGVDPDYLKYEDRSLSEFLEKYAHKIMEEIVVSRKVNKTKIMKDIIDIGEKLKSEYFEASAEFAQDYFVDPILNVVGMLPKDELAAMAESLVNLTSFKRRVTMQYETVGGPIDVAIISKNDGFVWVKRKHYFKAELNPNYFKNYYNDVDEEGV